MEGDHQDAKKGNLAFYCNFSHQNIFLALYLFIIINLEVLMIFLFIGLCLMVRTFIDLKYFVVDFVPSLRVQDRQDANKGNLVFYCNFSH